MVILRRMLGRRLRVVRVSSGFHNIGDYAVLIGVSVGRYQRIEAGKDEPSPFELATIAQITGKSLDFLITGSTTILMA